MDKAVFTVLAIIVAMPASSAFAHTTIEVGPYEIEAGWGTEPSIVGLRNTVVYSITESEGSVNRGVTSALSNVDVTLKFGGVEEPADILNDPRPGSYYTKIIPSRVGSYSVGMVGQINGVDIDVVIPIEDVNSAAALNFPPSADSGDSADIASLRNAISAMQRDLDSSQTPVNSESAYDIALFGAAFGIAGTILAVIAMSKRK